jgi:hypothetical protein
LAVAVASLMLIGGALGTAAPHGAQFVGPGLSASVPEQGLAPAAAITPNIVPPWPWEQTAPIVLVMDFEWTSNGTLLPAVQLPGQLTLKYGTPVLLGNGSLQVPAMVSNLTAGGGSYPQMHLRIDPYTPSTGALTERKAGEKIYSSTLDVFFDVFFDTPAGVLTLSNAQALPLAGKETFLKNGTIIQGSILAGNGAPATFANADGSAVLTLTGIYLVAGLVPCLYYTENGQQVGSPVCNPRANDLEVDFNQSSAVPCAVQFTLNGQPLGASVQCPAGANDFEAYWGTPPASPPFLLRCAWTFNGVPLSTACQVPASAPANDFTLTAGTITQASWTHNGKLLRPFVSAPNGTNDIEFFLYSSGYPVAGSDTFTSSAVLELSTPTGGALPALVLSGVTTVMRGAPSLLPNGVAEIPTEITSMELTGTSSLGPVSLTLNPTMASVGQVLQGSTGVDFPATSFFDVFTEVSVGNGTYSNAQGDNVSAMITSIPPSPGTVYANPAHPAIPLEASNGSTAFVLTAGFFIVGTPSCFFYTENGLPLGAPVCDPQANDLTVDFAQTAGASCAIQFTTFGSNLGAPQPCPRGANDMETHWNNTAAGAVITACSWTRGGHLLTGTTCTVPPTAPANDFAFTATKVVRALWTLNGTTLKPVSRAPAGANDIEFFSMYNTGYPPAGTDTFPATAVVDLQALNGTAYPGVVLTGTTTVMRGNPIVLKTGLAEIPTVLETLNLAGNSSMGPVMLSLNPSKVSTGEILQQGLGMEYSVHSFFDVFTEITLGGQTFDDSVPANVSANLTSIPPSPGTIFQTTPGQTIPYYGANGTPAFNLVAGYLVTGLAACFVFTSNGLPVGGPVCNPNSNDVEVNFTQLVGAVCSTQFTLGGGSFGPSDLCPTSANELEVNWTGSASGPVITSCYWAISGVPVGSCPVPSPPQPNGFAFSLAQITSVGWTVNGQVVGKPVPAPAVANDVEFFF